MENYLHGTGHFSFASSKRLFCFETKRLQSLFPCSGTRHKDFHG